MALRTLLGLDAEDGVLRVTPAVPDSLGRLSLQGLRVHGKKANAG